jgi:glyoxylase-like metal-dependent hydrolase (beta-lactamase superfamily II)
MWIRALENEATGAQPPLARRTRFDGSPRLEMRMFRVEEGEAILVVFPGDTAWLVDCGNTAGEEGNRQLASAIEQYLVAQNLTLVAVVASHSHFDHMGALETLLVGDSSALDNNVIVYRATGQWRRDADFLDRYHDIADAPGSRIVERIFDPRTEELLSIAPGIEAHFFVGSAAGVYESLFVRLHFGFARILFARDAFAQLWVATAKRGEAVDR